MMEILIQHIIKAFGWSILNSLWQSALIYGVLFIVLLSIPKMAARYKHNLAFGAIILMFGGFIYSFIKQMIMVVPQNIKLVDPTNVNQIINQVQPDFSSKAEQYFPLVVAFYILGIFLQLFVIIKGYRQLSRLKKENISAVPESWIAIFENILLKLNIKKVIKFQLSSMVNVPLVIGYIKPVVLFPVALVNQLDQDQVEAILIHELSHIRRNDFLLNLIKTAIETLLFYNPFVWLAGRFIQIEREHACDDLVLQITGKPLNYAHALLKLELLKDKTSPAYALAATGKSQNLYQRIKRITNMKTNYLNAKQQMAALTLAVACLFSIAWINPAEKKREKVLNPKVITKIVITNGVAQVVCIDTTRKNKTKIITVDAKGKRTTYNSVNEMPDSLKIRFEDGMFKAQHGVQMFADSNFKFKDSVFKINIEKQFNSPEAQAKWKKYGEDMEKRFNSPQEQAKWKKFGEDIAKEYSSPEAQAKWKKFGEDIAKEYSSPEAQAKWKKFGEDISKQYLSAENLAQRRNEDKVFIVVNGDTLINEQRPSGKRSKSFNYSYSDSNDKIKSSEEYKILKEKFDKEVKELKEKIDKKEKAEN